MKQVQMPFSQEMGTGLWACKGRYRQLQVARGLVLPPLGEGKPECPAEPGDWLAGQPHSAGSQARGGRLQPGDAGLAGVGLKDGCTQLTPTGWNCTHLQSRSICSLPEGKQPSTKSWNGDRVSLPQQEAWGLGKQPQGSGRLCDNQSQFLCYSLGHWDEHNSM